MTTETILRDAGLDPALVRKMTTFQQLTSVPCPTCHVGRGRKCIDLPVGRVVHDGRAPFGAGLYR
jgi:hypothetical protein